MVRRGVGGFAVLVFSVGLGAHARAANNEEPAAAEGAELMDLALAASGYEDPASLRVARAKLERLVGPLVSELAQVKDERARAERLLRSLHQKGGALGRYEARATTLREVIERRRFNCVSASVLYNLLAERLGLQVGAQLLPTHARSLVLLSSGQRLERVVVETTSAQGFDPDPASLARILAEVAGPQPAGAQALVSPKGEVVSTRVLIGTIYMNRASIAQEGGQLDRAEQLFAEGEGFGGTEAMRRLLRDHRAALLAQLAADDITSGQPALIERALRTMKAALALRPEGPRVRRVVHQNLRAATERVLSQAAKRGDEAAVWAIAEEIAALPLEPASRAGIRAFALSEIGRLRLEAGRFEAALEALETAGKERLGPSDAELARSLEQNTHAALRLAAMAQARRGDMEAALALIDRLEALPRTSAARRSEAAGDRLRVIHLVGAKRLDERNYAGAADAYRLGLARFPSDETARHNLSAVLERLALPLVDEGRCAEAKALIDEIRAVASASEFPAKAMVRCYLEGARSRLAAGDYAQAVALMRAAEAVRPEEPAVSQNLMVALLRWAKAASEGQRCAEVTRLVGELRGLGRRDVPEEELARLERGCRS